jgi:hypothetical protein
MKKLILIALAFVAIQATAQEQKRDHKKGQSLANLSAEEIATIQTKKMTLRLDLNDSQQREIQKINLEEATTRKAHMEERKAKKEGDKVEKPSKEDRVAMMNKMLDHKIEVKAKMKKILNDEQYAKWEADQEKRSKNRKGNGKSNKGGGKK